MQKLRIYPTSINDSFIAQAVEMLRRGGVVIYPTDTVYAIGCDALNQSAIQKVCRLKGINAEKRSLSVVCSDISQASEYARIDNRAYALLRSSLPGPFTFVLPASNTLPKAFKGRREVGIRVPDNAIARRLAVDLGHPLMSTSVPEEWFEEGGLIYPEEICIAGEQRGVDLMIDGGEGDDRYSTVVDLTDSASPEILRRGKGELVI